MFDRKKKIKFVQYSLFLIAIFLLIHTYANQKDRNNNKIFSESSKEKITKSITSKNDENKNKFYNIEYSGLDFSGNRYILRSEEAIADNSKSSTIHLRKVNAKFYFKDDTVLNITSDNGTYNNITLDINFKKNVKADYGDNRMISDEASFANSKGYLRILNNVKLFSTKGDLIADELLFDIKSQNLEINSFNDNNINAKINLNEKNF